MPKTDIKPFLLPYRIIPPVASKQIVVEPGGFADAESDEVPHRSAWDLLDLLAHWEMHVEKATPLMFRNGRVCLPVRVENATAPKGSARALVADKVWVPITYCETEPDPDDLSNEPETHFAFYDLPWDYNLQSAFKHAIRRLAAEFSGIFAGYEAGRANNNIGNIGDLDVRLPKACFAKYTNYSESLLRDMVDNDIDRSPSLRPYWIASLHADTMPEEISV